MKKQYKMFLNILITLLVVAGIGILGYLAYDYLSKLILTKEAEAAVDDFLKTVEQATNFEEQNVIVIDVSEENNNEIENTIQNTSTNTTQKSTPTYKNFNIIGSIQIPKTKIKYPVVDTITPDAVAVAVTKIYGPGLNEVRKYSFSCS